MTTIDITPIAPRPARWGSSIREAWARRALRRATARALCQLSARELADIGLSRDDVAAAAASAVRDAALRLAIR